MKKIWLASLILASSTLATSQSDFNTFPTPGYTLPEVGSSVGLIDQYKERFIGEKVYRQVQRQLPVLHDPWLEDQLSITFSHILAQTQLGQPIGMLIIKDPQINAFAVPGGLFALNLGLINSARNMDEVAGVMAHEIAHVTQRHYSRSQEDFKGQGLLALAGIVVGALVASKADGDAGAAVMVGSQAALADKQLSYSRNQEREADRIGMQYMYSAGFNPHSMADFFEVMHRATSRVSFLPDFWFTHPLTTERMSEARLRATQLPVVRTKIKDEQFNILKWYSLVLSNQTNEQQLKTLVKQKDQAATFALAAFYMKQTDYKAAQQTLDLLESKQKLETLYFLLQTDIYLQTNQVAKAFQTISSPSRVMPENRALAYKLAEVYLQQNDSVQAQKVIKRFLDHNPRDVSGWELMQQAANIDAAHPLRAINVLRYRAEKEYWSGHEEAGIKSLLHAQRLAQSNDAMLNVVKERLSQMQKEYQQKI